MTSTRGKTPHTKPAVHHKPERRPLTPAEARRLGQQIHQHRTEQDLTVAQLAQALDASTTTVAHWEAGGHVGDTVHRIVIAPATFHRLADALGVPAPLLARAARLGPLSREALGADGQYDPSGPAVDEQEQAEQAAAVALGRAIADHRVACGLTQGQLAFIVGAPQRQVEGWERGWIDHGGRRHTVRITVARLHTLAAALHCQAADLLDEFPAPTENVDEFRFL